MVYPDFAALVGPDNLVFFALQAIGQKMFSDAIPGKAGRPVANAMRFVWKGEPCELTLRFK